MNRRAAIAIACFLLLALLALLIYSLDRTSWLLAQYESNQPGTLAEYLGLSPLALGVAAALVIEVGAVALVGGDVLALEQKKIRFYATAGLIVVLSVQALANLLAGYLRGYASVRATLLLHGASVDAAWWIAGVAWVLSSAAVPALIFILSKLAAHVVRLALSAPQSIITTTTDQRSEGAQERSASALPSEAVSQPAEGVERSENGAQDQAVEPVSAGAVVPLDRYRCPHCGRALSSGRAVGAAKTNGFCQNCKEERKRA